jgi:hypothetical protein
VVAWLLRISSLSKKAIVENAQQFPHYPWSLIEVITLYVLQSKLEGV